MPSRLPNGHSHDALPTGSSAGIEGSDGDNNAKVTHSTRLSKFRDKFYRQNIDNHRPGDAAPGKEVLLPARRVAESDFRRHETRKDGAPTPRNSGVPGVPEGRNATFRDRSTPEPQDTEVSEHRNREARKPRGSRGLGAQGARSTGGIPKTHPLRTPPAVSGPSPRSRRSGTCRRPRGGRAGRHPRSPRCSAGSGTPAR